MRTKEFCDLRFTNLALSNSQDKFHKVLSVSIDRSAIDFEEHHSRFQPDSFVAIYERVVLDKMKQVRSRHFEIVPVQELPAKGSFRLSDRRLKQFGTPQAIASTIGGNLTGVEFHNIVKSQEIEHRSYSASFLNVLL